MCIGQPAERFPSTAESEVHVPVTRARKGTSTKSLIRAGLIVGLRLGLNVLCGDA